MYEFSKQNDEDPDFQSPAAFALLGTNYWAAFWVDNEGASCPEDIRFRLQLLAEPFKAKLDANRAEKVQDLLDRKKEREQERKYREQAAADAESSLHDDLNMGAVETGS